MKPLQNTGHFGTPNTASDFHSGSPTWVFGYGSLIYKIDFPYLERKTGTISGWTRRFWQGSHDHRGTPRAPGRVVTLLPARGVICKGAAYLVEPSVFKHLDHREKNGYRQMPTEITFDCGSSVAGVVYVADRHNPAFLGDAPITDVAAQIAASHGPSGSNRDYLLQLAAALRELGDGDTHVQALEALLRQSS